MLSSPPQHSPARSIFLHLAPGVVIGAVYFGIGVPLCEHTGQPTLLALGIAVIVALLPWELGGLFMLARAEGKSLARSTVVGFRAATPAGQRAAIVLGLLAWAILIAGLMSSVDDWVRSRVFGWFPSRFDLEYYSLGSLGGAARWSVFLTNIGLFGIAAPVVEELYFRGHLLPRMQAFGRWAPVVNWALFSLYHTWTPWLAISRFCFGVPISIAVHWRQDIRIGIWAHVALNCIGLILSAAPDLFR